MGFPVVFAVGLLRGSVFVYALVQSTLGPPASTGFPYTYTRPEVSGIDRCPRPCWSLLWASRFDGPLGCISFGLRRGPASMYVVVSSMLGLPRGRASSYVALGPPAWTGLPVSVDLRCGSPDPTGFTYLLHWASWLIPASKHVVVLSMPGLPRGPASLAHSLGPPAWTGLPVPVDLCYGPPGLSGFPVAFRVASDEWTGFQVCHRIVDIGPPAWTGFPPPSIGASGVDRSPRPC